MNRLPVTVDRLARLVLTLALVAAAGCHTSDDDPTGSDCGPTNQCPEGWTCDPDTLKCLVEISGGGIDASVDAAAAIPDAALVDAGRVSRGDAAPHTDAASRPDAAPRPDATVDSQPPQTTIDNGPPTYTSETSATFDFSSEPGASFLCSLDGSAESACDSPATFGPLEEGTHTLTVRAVDAAGNPDPDPATATWTVDLTPPDTFITDGPSGTVASSSASFSFRSDEPGTFKCSLDGAPETACTTPWPLTGLGLGSHKFEVRAIDRAANPDPVPDSRTWTVDTVLPIVTIDSGPSGATMSATATFTFHSPNKPASTFECDLDGLGYESCTSGKSYPGLREGAHTFSVRGTDASGTGDSTVAEWTVDRSGPTVMITRGPTDPSNDPAPSFIFSASEGTVECDLDDTGFGPCTSATTQRYSGLDDRTHTFTVRATDDAGNPGSDQLTWTIDTMPPSLFLDDTPADPSNDTAPAFAFHSSEAGTFECQLDTDFGPSPCSSGDSFPVDEGLRTFSVYAVDAAGNPSSPTTTYSWTVDLTPPTTYIDDPVPSDPSNDPAPAFYFYADEPASEFWCMLDTDNDYFPCASGDTVAVSDGARMFRVYSIDLAGNPDPYDTIYEWTVDTMAPTTTIDTGPPASTSSTSATFTFHSSEPAGASFRCQLDTDAADAPCASGDTFNVDPGSRTMYVYAVDAAGNVDPVGDSWSWTVDASPPDTMITQGPGDPTAAITASFSFQSTKPGGTFKCGLDMTGYSTSGWTDCSSPAVYGSLGPGEHRFSVYAIDDAGQADATPATATWHVSAGDGHVVLIGMDLITNSDPAKFPDASTVVGNAVNLANPAGASAPIEVLGFPGGATSDEVKFTQLAITWRLEALGKKANFSKLDDPGKLAEALVGKQVFLIYDQNKDADSMKALGASIAPVVDQFVYQGGVFIVQDGVNQPGGGQVPSGTAQILSGAGLLAVNAGGAIIPAGSNMYPDLTNGADPVAAGVNVQGYTAPEGSVVFSSFDRNWVIRWDNPAVIHKPFHMVESFELGDPAGWAWAPWTTVGGGGEVAGAYAHDGNRGLLNTGWKYRTDVVFDHPGDRLSAWFRFTPGTPNIVYLGVGASADGTKAVALASGADPVRTTIAILDDTGWNDSLVQSEVINTGLAWNTWYKIEVEHGSEDYYVTARVYDSTGTNLLYTFANGNQLKTPANGGVALKVTGGGVIDTVVYHQGPR